MPSNQATNETPLRLGVWASDNNNFHFLEPILDRLPSRFKVQKFTWSQDVPDAILEQQLRRVDLAWFEWGTGPVIPASKLTANIPTVCRMHRYEIYTPAPQHIQWANIDSLTLISSTLESMFRDKHGQHFPADKKIEVVPNAIDVDKFPFQPDRQRNFNLAFLGRLHFIKNPMLLIQVFKKICDQDNRYQLHIAGPIQHVEVAEYLLHQIKQMGLQKNVHFYGELKREEVLNWLPLCSYLLSTSVIEGHPVGVMEAMAMGVRPVIHDFFGSRAIFPEEFIFNTVDEAASMILEGAFEPQRYRDFIVGTYNLTQQVERYVGILDNLVRQYYPERAMPSLTNAVSSAA